MHPRTFIFYRKENVDIFRDEFKKVDNEWQFELNSRFYDMN